MNAQTLAGAVGKVSDDLHAYQEAIDDALQTSVLGGPLDADFKSFYLGPLRVIELVASPRRSERTRAQIARDRHSGISLQLAVSGVSDGEARGAAVLSRPGTVMVLDFGQPFVFIDREPRHVINVSFPRPLFEAKLPDVRQLHGAVFDEDAGGLLAAYLGALTPRLPTMAPHAVPVFVDHLTSLALLMMSADPGGDPRSGDKRSALLERATQLIDNRLGSRDLSPDWIIDRMNISRSELYSLFKGESGVVRFIWKRRLEAAHRALTDERDQRRVGEIAYASGFASEAHFARAFRATYGMTASEARKAAG